MSTWQPIPEDGCLTRILDSVLFGRTQVSGFPGCRARPSDHEYLLFGVNGVCLEGQLIPTKESLEDAIASFVGHLALYIIENVGAIVWRLKPEIETYIHRKKTKYAIRARFVVVPDADAASLAYQRTQP